MPTDRSARRPGRPRDASIDTRVLEAARELLVELGYEATTVQAIAERSGVHASAIYRRWPSRVEIIEQAVFPGLDSIPVRPTGDLRRDLRRFIRSYVTTLGSPVARAAAPGLLASYQSRGRAGMEETLLAVSARPQFLDILRAAPSGAVDPEVDPDDVFDMLLGAILARSLVPTVAQRQRPVERLVDLCLRLVQPAGVSDAAVRS
jgi:AcrR family transcriptional regulator